MIGRAERFSIMMVLVSLVGEQVAVCKSHDTAIKQIGEMVMATANQNVSKALDNGDARMSFRVRTVYVELNER